MTNTPFILTDAGGQHLTRLYVVSFREARSKITVIEEVSVALLCFYMHLGFVSIFRFNCNHCTGDVNPFLWDNYTEGIHPGKSTLAIYHMLMHESNSEHPLSCARRLVYQEPPPPLRQRKAVANTQNLAENIKHLFSRAVVWIGHELFLVRPEHIR